MFKVLKRTLNKKIIFAWLPRVVLLKKYFLVKREGNGS